MALPLDAEALQFGKTTHPWFLPQDSPYKVWIWPLSPSNATRLIRPSEAVVGLLVNKSLRYTLAAGGGWGAFKQTKAPMLSGFLQFAESIGWAKDLKDWIERKGGEMAVEFASYLGLDPNEVAKKVSTANNAKGAMGAKALTELIYSGQGAYLSIPDVTMLFTTNTDAMKDVYYPMRQLAAMSVQRETTFAGVALLHAPYKVAVRIGQFRGPMLRMDSAVIQNLTAELGTPLDQNGIPTWGKATFQIQSARVATALSLVNELFSGKGR